MIDTTLRTDFVVDQATRRGSADARGAPSRVFQGFLDRARTEGGDPESQLREAAEKFVSTSMIMPLFSQLRASPLAENPFNGGRAESVFQQQLDQVMADRIAGATRFDLVDAVHQQLSRAAKAQANNAERAINQPTHAKPVNAQPTPGMTPNPQASIGKAVNTYA